MQTLKINERSIGPGFPAYIIAEMSANHCQDFQRAVDILRAAKDSGADAVKIQTYTPDTITIDCQREPFLFQGRTLYDLYKEAYTPWEWHPLLKKEAESLKIDLFSSPFDESAVDFLETMAVPAYKLASSEIVDIPLIKKVAQTRKPIILSTGMASQEEIAKAVTTIRQEGGSQIALLKCAATYPAKYQEMNLKTIRDLSSSFDLPVGLSDHSLGNEASIAAVALGAVIIERHFILKKNEASIDASFSLEPKEFRQMVDSIRKVEVCLGGVVYGPVGGEVVSKNYRRSLFIVKDLEAGAILTKENVRSIRPGQGLLPEYLPQVIGRKAKRSLAKGTPLTWDDLE